MRLEFGFPSILLYIVIVVILGGIIYYQSIRDILIIPKDIYKVEHIYVVRDEDGHLYKITGSVFEKKSAGDLYNSIVERKDKTILVRVSGFTSPKFVIGRYIINSEDTSLLTD